MSCPQDPNRDHVALECPVAHHRLPRQQCRDRAARQSAAGFDACWPTRPATWWHLGRVFAYERAAASGRRYARLAISLVARYARSWRNDRPLHSLEPSSWVLSLATWHVRSPVGRLWRTARAAAPTRRQPLTVCSCWRLRGGSAPAAGGSLLAIDGDVVTRFREVESRRPTRIMCRSRCGAAAATNARGRYRADFPNGHRSPGGVGWRDTAVASPRHSGCSGAAPVGLYAVTCLLVAATRYGLYPLPRSWKWTEWHS